MLLPLVYTPDAILKFFTHTTLVGNIQLANRFHVCRLNHSAATTNCRLPLIWTFWSKELFLSHYSDLRRKISSEILCPTNLYQPLRSDYIFQISTVPLTSTIDYIVIISFFIFGNQMERAHLNRSADKCSATELHSRLFPQRIM